MAFTKTSICKGETLRGYLLRRKFRGSPRNSREIEIPRSVSWLLPSNLKDFEEKYGTYLGSALKVMRENTINPGVSRFAPAKVTKELFSFQMGDSRKIFPPMRLGLTSHGTTSHTWDLGICIRCLDEDVTPCGESFWRRDFLLTSITMCPRHESRILALCGNCRHSNRNSNAYLPPSSRCLCPNPLAPRIYKSDIDIEHLELELAKGWSRALDENFAPNMSSNDFLKILKMRAAELGLSINGAIQWEKVRNFFSRPDLTEMAKSLRFNLKSYKTQYLFSGREIHAGPIHMIFALNSLFGNWQAVEDAISSNYISRHDFIMKPVPLKNKRRKSNYTNERYLRHREESIDLFPKTIILYKRIQDKFPGISHTEILRFLPFKNQFAVNIDRLQEHGVENLPVRNGPISTSRIDEIACKYIAKRGREFIRTGADFRITPARLLSRCPVQVYILSPEAEKTYPQTSAALRRYSEDLQQFHRRAIRFAVSEGSFCLSPMFDAVELSKLPKTKLAELYKQLRRTRELSRT
ncbi:hypothetical protein [Paraburkholderia tropica]|uniref:hypothetical protein n=1 Tax=Paraburkholderia tropica TaxID=92647 RepID=UPI0031D373AD